MISEFDWCGCTALTPDKMQDVEKIIAQTFEARGIAELKPCHKGPIKVQLNIVGTHHSDLVGNISCSCGKKYCKFSGARDGSSVTFDRTS